MQLSQLQGLIQECKKIVRSNEKLISEEHIVNKQTALVSKQIRSKRIQITQLKYEVKRNVKLQKQSKETSRGNQSLQRQFKDIKAIRNMQSESYQKISTIVQNLQRQIDSIDKKVVEAQNQIEKQAEQDQLIIRNNSRQVTYLKLKKQLQLKSASNRKYNQNYFLNSSERLKNISPINDLIGKIDLKHQQLCEKIQVQKEIINKICKSQFKDKSNNKKCVNSRTETDKLQQNAHYQLKKNQELNPFQKVEITNILLREQFKKQQEDILMGRIVRQNIRNTYNLGRIVNNRYKFKYNLSEISKIGDTLFISQQFENKGKIDFSNQNNRLKKLQPNKRIRTRQTQMRRYSQQYRNILLNDSQEKNVIEPLPSKSILDVYSQLKKVRTTSNKIGNIEVIKLMKYNQKRKRLSSEKGGGLQISDQY